ncbi:MAG: glycosyltransferase [Patescibacteria group bacterium]
MQKILYVITKQDTGGAQKYVADLAGKLDQSVFDPKIIRGGVDVKWLSNRTLPFALFANDIFAVIELVSIFRKERPNVIHLNSSKAGVIGSLAGWLYKFTCRPSHVPCPKIIFTAHGWVFNPTNAVAKPIQLFYRILHRIAALFQNVIINVSQHDHDLALHYRIAPPHKLVTIHNGIDPNIPFLDRDNARKEIVKKLTTNNQQLTTHGIWIGSIGRLTKEKDYETLVRTAALVPDVYFFIIGEGKEKSNLKSKISNLKMNDRFFIVPPTGEDAEYLKAFDIFTMTSIKEGLPYVLLEAMAAEIPSIITNTGGMPEAISNPLHIIPIRNAKILARKIIALAHDKPQARETGEINRKRVMEEFSLETMIRKTKQIYCAE